MRIVTLPAWGALVLVIAGLAACSDDDITELEASEDYEIPATYAGFTNVSYSGQQARLAMLGEMKDYMRNAASGTAIDSVRLSAMYANAEGADFSRDYEKDIRSKTLSAVAEDFEGYIGQLARAAENSEETASDGEAGVATSLDGERTYLLDANGVEWAQVIEKGLMGATFYYQATGVYLAADKMSADNVVVQLGEGTAMQHHFDEAFGYLGVPLTFPEDTEGAIFWGDYAVDRDVDIDAVSRLGEAFTRGRAAIGAEDYEARDAAIADIRTTWEEVVASTAVHYLNSALSQADDPARRLHSLSEAAAFIYALAFNPITQTDRDQISSLLTQLGGSDEFATMDLYGTSDSDISTVRAELAATYGWMDIAANL